MTITVSVDQYRSVDITVTDKFKAFVVAYRILSDDVTIISKHSSDALAIRAGRLYAFNNMQEGVRVILEDGQSYHLEAFAGKGW